MPMASAVAGSGAAWRRIVQITAAVATRKPPCQVRPLPENMVRTVSPQVDPSGISKRTKYSFAPARPPRMAAVMRFVDNSGSMPRRLNSFLMTRWADRNPRTTIGPKVGRRKPPISSQYGYTSSVRGRRRTTRGGCGGGCGTEIDDSPAKGLGDLPVDFVRGQALQQ